MSFNKQRAAAAAAELITDGMVLGLGTGTTASYLLQILGAGVTKEEVSAMREAWEAEASEDDQAKRALRDAMYSGKYCSPDKAKLMDQPMSEAALLTGVALEATSPTVYSHSFGKLKS